MAQPPFYVRVFTTSLDRWFVPKPDGAALAKQVFNLKDSGQSTYEVRDEIEEVAAAAAYFLAADKAPENCHVARFCRDDLSRAEVKLDGSTLGYTGIAAIDYQHRDLVAPETELRRLLEIAIGRLHAGEDVIRSIKKVQLTSQLTRFIALPVGDRPTHTAHLCELLLERRQEADVSRDRVLAEGELNALTIPQESIRERAQSLWARNGQPVGSDDAHWYAAETELRDEYRKHYLNHYFRT